MKEKAVTKKRRKYDAGFKEEVLRMVSSGRPVNEIAQSLGIGENLIYKWKSRYVHMAHQPEELKGIDFAQVEGLNRRIRELETERDILKKALAIFSRQT
ncbi:transposase [Adhaeribacter rhizoryzae]|uniref:Transposase n=1 Tax=Adhaeribacter rhizoryzae TaxID=2607907 RepID=A0A5M6D518_9BACT|nr:transposase [Adhaeribacter rhizoryzae]KAA5541680.1 transposase [Adhaeribacter rhizoryzae]